MKEKPKVLIIKNVILDYSVDLYNEIGKESDLTVAHGGNFSSDKNLLFKTLKLNEKRFFGFVFQQNLFFLVKEFDYIFLTFDIKYLSNVIPLLLKQGKKYILWGIGVSSKKGLTLKSNWNFIRIGLAHLSDGLILYSEFPLKLYNKYNFLKNKISIAHNTVNVDFEYFQKKTGEHYIFIGSLNKRKKIPEMLNDYHDYVLWAIKNSIKPKNLMIIGEGSMRCYIESFVNKNSLNNFVNLKGYITDQTIKTELFSKAICSISLGQCGLSVLESMGYATPFITYKNAISGGEIYNIKNDNGFLIDQKKGALTKLLINLDQNKYNIKMISRSAYDWYYSIRTIKKMADIFINYFNKHE